MDNKKKIFWFTGLSGSGKSTIAALAEKNLIQKGLRVKIVDGDDVRKTINKSLGFSPADIIQNNKIVIGICKELINKYDVLLVTLVSPFREMRGLARKEFDGQFVEVFVKASQDEVKKRDPKGLYKKNGTSMIGFNQALPFEEPINPELLLDTQMYDAKILADNIGTYLNKQIGLT